MRKIARLEISSNQIDEESKSNFKLGSYQILFEKLIGKGAFSKVYLCRNNQNKIAAVKIISKEKNKSQHAVTLAKTQARILKPLYHENLVELIDSYESSRNFYLLLKYYEGKTLKDIISSKTILTSHQKLYIISQLIIVLRYLHHRNIVHRDLKPDNIKIRKNYKIVLLDFGFAKQLVKGEQTQMSEWVGTPSYMSPQMLSQNRYNSKTDIWSLGVLAYELIYGDVPFKGKDQSDLLANINKYPLIIPKKPHISSTTKQFIKSCLKANPKNRISWKQIFLFDNVKAFKQEDPQQICCKC